MASIAGIYRLVHLEAGLSYVGSTRDIKRRLAQHQSLLHKPAWFYRLPEQVSCSEMVPEVLESMPGASDLELAEAELDWVLLLKPELNGEVLPDRKGCSGFRPRKSWTVAELMRFVAQERGWTPHSNDGVYLGMSKEKAWSAALEAMEDRALLRRGDLQKRLS